MGISQGNPLSSSFYCFLTEDLPDEIRQSATVATIYGVVVTCLMYMDDIAIPVHTAHEVKAVPTALWEYTYIN